MSCEIKIKSLDFLKEKGALDKGRVVKDLTKFNELNEVLTHLADTKYMVKSPKGEKLFSSESKYVKNLDGSYRHLVRAIPNEELFNTLQVAVDEYAIVPIGKNSVEYSLKAIDILSSTKAEQIFTKGKKNGWDLNKILTELQIPKEQKQIILDKNIKVQSLDSIIEEEGIMLNRYPASNYFKNNPSDFNEISNIRESIIDLPINNIITTENFVEEKVKKLGGYRNPEYNKYSTDFPIAIKINNKIFLLDGHHRLELAKRSNQSFIKVAVKDVTSSYRTDLIEEIITSLLAENSFVVEVNTAKNKVGGTFAEISARGENPYEQNIQEDTEIIDTTPTQYYSSLTVPGGTNYTENEISTPDITPNIKGHAQFSTDNGIGWFRSDETSFRLDNSLYDEAELTSKIIKHIENPMESKTGYIFIFPDNSPAIRSNTKEEHVEKLKNLLKEVESNKNHPKTRRILEVQSDWAQKLRLDFVLDGIRHQIKTENKVKKHYINNKLVTSNQYQKAFEDFIERGELVKNGTKEQNDFARIILKNWVNFFIQSIVQDSVRKGYEKVLFPTGNTAAKVEGHQTLEEFKIQKEQGIKNARAEIKQIKDKGNNTEQELSIIEGLEKQIETFKQELADVESGQTQLSSIANFYEDTITNILKKKGYNPIEITDEYGNTWNGVDLLSVDTKILLKEIDLNELLDENKGEQLKLEELNYTEPFSEEKEHGTINEFILFNNQEGRNDYSAVEVLENIIKNFDGFSKHSDLFLSRAKVLLASTKAKVKIVNTDELINSDTFMQYNPTDNTIHISLNNLRGVSNNFAIHAFLHEVTHSVTHSAYHNPISVDQKLFKATIDAAYNKYNTGYRQDTAFDSYGFANPIEFIAEIFTNPSFIQEIKNRDAQEKGNLWSKILEAIRSLFGLPKNPSYDSLIELITDISSTKQMNSRGQIFEIKKKPTKEEDKLTSLKTIEDKLDYTIDKIEESIERNIQSLEFTAKRSKDEKRTQVIESYIESFDNILKEVKEFRDTNQLAAVTTFLSKMASNVSHIKRRIQNINYDNKEDVTNVLGVYQDYLSTFAVINNIEDVIASIRTNLDTQTNITEEELDTIETSLKFSKGEYSFLEKRMYEILKKGMKTILNDIKYFKQVEHKHRLRLEKEHKESKIPTNKQEWIIDKMQNRDKDLIQEDLDKEILKLIEDPSFDILGVDVLFSSAINVSAPLIQIMNQVLFDIKNDKNKIIQDANIELNTLFNKLSEEKGSTNPKILYKNILEYDSTGKPYFKSDFSIKFYEEVQQKLLGLYKDLKEYKETSRAELKVLEEKGKNSVSAIKKRKEIAATIKAKNKEIDTIKENNVEFDDKGKVIGPKLKWKTDYSKLSKTENEVITLIHKRLNKALKDTYQQNPLVKFSFGTKFYELPKVTKTDLERLMLDGGKRIIKDKFTDLTEIRPDDIGYDTTIRTDIENNRLFNLKVHYRDKTNSFDPKNQSLDVFNLIRLETENGTMFKVRKESELLLKSLIDIAKNKTYYEKEGSKKLLNFWSKKNNVKSGKDSNIYKMMNNIMEQKFYDIFNKSNITLGKFDLNKTVKFINSSSAFLTLSLNLASGTANVLNANAQLFLESFLPRKGGFITASGIAKANRIYGANLAKTLDDITNPLNKSFVNQINEMFDITDSLNLTNSGFLKTNMIKAGFDRNSLQVFQSTGEHWIQSVTTMAVLDGVKALNSEGKFIDKTGKVVSEKKAASLLDMLEVDKITGQINMNPAVVYSTHSKLTKWKEGGKTNVDMLIRKKLYDTLGNYTELDQPEIMRHWGGKLMMLYRKYLIPMGQARLRGWETSIKDRDKLSEDEKRFSFALQENEEGTYISLIRYLASVLRDHKYYLLSKPHWDRLTDYEKHNIKRATIEIVMTNVMLPLALMLVKGMADGDDDEYLFFLAYQLRRLDTEMSQYRDITETFKMMRSPVPSARFIQSSISIFEGIFTPWTWDNEYESGPNKGENVNWTRFKKQIPVVKEFQRSYEGLLKYQESTWGSGL